MEITEVINMICERAGVEIKESEIERAYKIKRNNKIIVEFTTVTKKREIMDKIKNHRVEIAQSDGSSNFIFLNDELTPYNRKLLWMAKTKAKESGWKFIWVKNGNIYARKNENSPLTNINNTADLENIISSN